jgi:glutathione synthase/RimK-type ligase-like ATP-grasp enzyme
LLKENSFPVVDSYIFWGKDAALAWLDNHDSFPLVHKLRNGAGSLTVTLIRDKDRAAALIRKMFGSGILQDNISVRHIITTLNYDPVKIFRYYAINFRNRYLQSEQRQVWLRHKNYIFFQKFLPGNEWDTRVTTAGKRAHAFRRFTRPGDFRASGSNRWDIDPSKIDLRMVKIALTVSRTLGFQAMAYDFIYDLNKEPRIVEMSYLYGGAGYPDFMNGYWDENLVWYPGRFWPQLFEMTDLLQIPELRTPELDTDTSYKKARIQTII